MSTNEATQIVNEAIQKRYEECVLTVRRTMLVKLAFCFFCLVTIFGTPDSAFVVTEAPISVPFANVQLAFPGFLVAAPFLLIVLTLYEQVFNASRLEIESTRQVSSVPTLFTMNALLPRTLTGFIFYWLVPLILVTITWKAMVRLDWGIPLFAVTIIVTVTLALIQIRRCSHQGVVRRLQPLSLPIVIACVTGFSVAQYEGFRRPLDLFRVDFQEKWLVDADLRGANLRHANLQNAKLEWARLERADLWKSTLKGADIRNANLAGAKLQYADLRGANLSQAQLKGADLSDANLQRADLSIANLHSAELGRADLRGTNMEHAFLRSADLGHANLQGANLYGATLEHSKLDFSDLRGANLRQVGLQGADLNRAKLQGARLFLASAQGAGFREANLGGANLRQAQLQGADFRHANLQGVDLVMAKLQWAKLDYANLRGADLRLAKIWQVDPPDKKSLEHVDLSGLILQQQDRKSLHKDFAGQRPPEEQLLAHRKSRLSDFLDEKITTAWKETDHYHSWSGLIRDIKLDLSALSSFLTELACKDDAGGYIAKGVAQRLLEREGFFIIAYNGEPQVLAKGLTKRNCGGSNSLDDDTKAKLCALAAWTTEEIGKTTCASY